jgi:hypothetical protein
MLDKLNQEEFKRSGLIAVKFEPNSSADFLFASFVSEWLKDGRTVVYISAGRSFESFRYTRLVNAFENCLELQATRCQLDLTPSTFITLSWVI